MIVWRLIHIFSGVLWVGATFTMIRFIEPAATAAGQEGQAFMRALSTRTRFSLILGLAATLTALSGIIMYVTIFDMSEPFASNYGLTLGIGGIAGIIAWASGFYFQGRSSMRMQAIAREMGAAGGPPAPEQLAEMRHHAERLALGGRITALLTTVALAAMAVAQYV